MKKDTLNVVTVLTSGVFLVALGWNLLETIGQGKQIAAVTKTQDDSQIALENYQKASDEKEKQTNDDITQLKIDVGTIKELTKLISYRYQIDPKAVEIRVKSEIMHADEMATSTVVKKGI